MDGRANVKKKSLSNSFSKTKQKRALKKRRQRYSYLKRIRREKFPSKRKISFEISNNKIIDFAKKISPNDGLILNDNNKILKVNLPKTFCLIRNPDASLQSIAHFINRVTSKQYNFIEFIHKNIDRYNLSAETLLAVLTERCVWHAKFLNKKRILIGGKFPEEKRHKKLICEIGIVKQVNAIASQRNSLFSRNSINVDHSNYISDDEKSNAAKEFARYIENSFGIKNSNNTDKFVRKLINILSEVLCNSERHSSSEKGYMWFVRGYVEDDICEIAIFNFGKTIAETFEGLPNDSFARKSIAPYLEKHSGPEFSTEQLCTIMALQHRISSKNTNDRDTNGQGTVDLIEFFELVNEKYASMKDKPKCKPEMSLISGNTYIYFDNKYKLHNIASSYDEERYIYPMNNNSNLNEKPDHNYVKEMDSFFPGVVISLRFPVLKNGE